MALTKDMSNAGQMAQMVTLIILEITNGGGMYGVPLQMAALLEHLQL